MRRLLIFALILMLAVPAATGEAQPDVSGYTKILDRFYLLISSPPVDYIAEDGETGVTEVLWALEPGEALECIGYRFEDLSGDGIPELLIGAVPREGDLVRGSSLYAVYTLADGAPRFLLEGWARSSYRLTKDGSFFHQGSNGAMYSIFGTVSLSPEDASIVWKDYYFTYEKDGNFEDIRAYHNTSGEWDPAVSEEIPLDDFWQIELDLIEYTRNAEFTPFSEYESVTK